jgi:DNA-binding response OmpR family regulator
LPAARRCASGNTAYACEEFILPQEQPLERIDHILVVDDDRDIRELIVDYLEKSGYRASGANGKAMWSVLKNHQIDLIVLDIMMPGEDGLTLCRQLRANPQQDIRVLLTARTDDSDRILGRKWGLTII